MKKNNKLKRNLTILTIMIVATIIEVTILNNTIVKTIKENKIANDEPKENYEKINKTMKLIIFEENNRIVTPYIGENIEGSEVKSMIEDIITYNNQHIDESGRFISIHNGKNGAREFTNGQYTVDTSKSVETFDGTNLDKICNLANIYENELEGENNQQNIDAATKEMKAFSEKIDSDKMYTVEAVKRDDHVYAVFVYPAD